MVTIACDRNLSMLVKTPSATSSSHPYVYRLKGAEWISQKGVWRMPMLHYSALLKALPAVPGVHVDVQPLPTVAQALVKVRLSPYRHQSAILAHVYAMAHSHVVVTSLKAAFSRCRCKKE